MNDPEVKGDAINCLRIDRTGKQLVMLARDNCIRLFDTGVLQRVAVCCSRCVAVCCSVLRFVAVDVVQRVAACCSVLRCVAVDVLQYVAVCRGVLQ